MRRWQTCRPPQRRSAPSGPPRRHLPPRRRSSGGVSFRHCGGDGQTACASNAPARGRPSRTEVGEVAASRGDDNRGECGDKGRKKQVTIADAMSCVCYTVTRKKERREKKKNSQRRGRSDGRRKCVRAGARGCGKYFHPLLRLPRATTPRPATSSPFLARQRDPRHVPRLTPHGPSRACFVAFSLAPTHPRARAPWAVFPIAAPTRGPAPPRPIGTWRPPSDGPPSPLSAPCPRPPLSFRCAWCCCLARRVFKTPTRHGPCVERHSPGEGSEYRRAPCGSTGEPPTPVTAARIVGPHAARWASPRRR